MSLTNLAASTIDARSRSRYSEPLRNPESLYGCISSARARVPNAELAIVTNTDYLKPTVLDQLVAAGLDVMYRSIYLRDKERWGTELGRAYNARLAHTLGLAETARSETSSVVRYSYEYKGMTGRSACINFDENGSNRGDLLAQYSDQLCKGPCREPFETFVIDYTGDVMPCCNLLSDRPEHRNYIIGNLLDAHASIFDLYAGKLSSWRRSMVTFGQKQQPCATCRHRDVLDGSILSIASRLDRKLSLLKFSEQALVGPSDR